MDEEKPRFMDTEGLAKEFGVPIATVRRWRYMGDGPPGIKLGRHVRYERRSVEEWLRERAAASTPRAAGREGAP